MFCNRARKSLLSSRQAPGAHGFPKLFESGQVSGDGLAPGELSSAIAALGVQEIKQARGAAPVGIFADVAVFLRHVEIAGSKVLSHPVVRLQRLLGVPHVSHHLPLRRNLLLLAPG